MSKTKLIPKHKTGYLFDYDPNNPYHVHSNGEKVVIDPEQYEKHKDEPYFANIRKQVEEHQAAYPGPEYKEVINPEYRKVYANVRAASNQHFKEHSLNGQIYREYSDVPEEYFRNGLDGVVTDNEGNLYRPMTQADVGKGVTPVFTNKERGHNGRYFDMSWVRVKTPEKTIRTLKQPLPVDRIYNVDEDLGNSVNNYIKNNTLTTEIVTNPLYYYKVPPLDVYANWPADVMSEKQLRDWNSNRPKRKRLSEKEIQDKLNSDYGTFNWTIYDPNTRKTKTYNKSVLYKDVPSISVNDFYNTEFQKLSEEQIRNMYKDLQGQTSLLFSVYPTAEDFLNDSNNRLEMITPGKSRLTTKSPTRQQALNNIQLNINANGGNLFHKGGLIKKHQRGQKITQKNPEYDFTVDFRKYVHNHNYPEYERSDEDKKKFNRLALKQYVSNQLKKYSDNIKNVAPDYYHSEYLPYLKSLKDNTVVSEIPVWSAKANGYELSNLNDLISYIENGYGTGGIEISGFNDYVKSLENTYSKYEKTPANPQYRKYLINKNKDKNSLYEASQFVLDYYSSPGYKERATKYNIERIPLQPCCKVKVLNAEPGEGSNAHTYLEYIRLDEDDAKNFTYPYIISHELGHFNPLYNTRSKVKTDDSPYSNHDYSDVPPKYKDILSGHGYENDHDAELSENYSDLMGLRESLFRLGIFDSKKSGSVFTLKMLNEYRKTKEGEKNRFLKHHTDQQIIDAINEIAYNNNNTKNVNSAQNGGNLFYNGEDKLRRLIAKKINDRVPGHEHELYRSVADRTETFNSSVIPIHLSAIQSYRKNDDNYVERLYDFYQDAIINPNSEEIVQNYKNITNRQYDDNSDYAIANNTDFIADNIRDFAPVYLAHEDAKSKYLGFPQRGNTVIESEYKPSKAKEQNTKYFKFKYQTPSYWSKVIKDMVGHNRVTKQYSDSILNTFTAERGVDPNKGEYISIYDIWDYNTNVFGGGKDNIGKYINGTPFEIYDRIYLDDYYNVNTSPESGTYYGRWLPEVKIIDSKNDKNNES